VTHDGVRLTCPMSNVHVKKEKKLRDVTSHIFAQTTHVALRPPKLSCGVGSKRSQPRQDSSKSVQGFWLAEGSKSAIFLCLALWLLIITGYSYRPTCD